MESLEDQEKTFVKTTKLLSEAIEKINVVAQATRANLTNNIEWKHGHEHLKHKSDDQLKYVVTLHKEFQDEYHLYLDLKDAVRVLTNLYIQSQKYTIYVKVKK